VLLLVVVVLSSGIVPYIRFYHFPNVKLLCVPSVGVVDDYRLQFAAMKKTTIGNILIFLIKFIDNHLIFGVD
jgi:hypothetical protein